MLLTLAARLTVVRTSSRVFLTTMRVQVLYFGVLKDVCGRERDEVSLPAGSAVASLIDVIRTRGATRPGLWESIAVAVNQEYVRSTVVLQDGDEVALLPPVSGGSGEAGTDAY